MLSLISTRHTSSLTASRQFQTRAADPVALMTRPLDSTLSRVQGPIGLSLAPASFGANSGSIMDSHSAFLGATPGVKAGGDPFADRMATLKNDLKALSARWSSVEGSTTANQSRMGEVDASAASAKDLADKGQVKTRDWESKEFNNKAHDALSQANAGSNEVAKSTKGDKTEAASIEKEAARLGKELERLAGEMRQAGDGRADAVGSAAEAVKRGDLNFGKSAGALKEANVHSGEAAQWSRHGMSGLSDLNSPLRKSRTGGNDWSGGGGMGRDRDPFDHGFEEGGGGRVKTNEGIRATRSRAGKAIAALQQANAEGRLGADELRKAMDLLGGGESSQQ